jgi:hypothetical protein
VVLDVQFGCLCGVMVGVLIMPLRGMGVVASFLVVAGLVVLGRFPMMSGCMFVVFGCLQVMLARFL